MLDLIISSSYKIGVYISVNGHNAQDLRNIYVNGEKDFTIEPADDQYTFTFNIKGSASSLVKFTLREIWSASYSPFVWILGLVGLFLVIPSGLSISVITYFRAPSKKTTAYMAIWSTSPSSPVT